MSSIKYEVRSNVAEIALDAAPVNALTESMLDEMLGCLVRASADPLVRAVILHSNVPRRFCAGLNLETVSNAGSADLHALVEKLYVHMYDTQTQLGKPSIAAVSGAARGGGMTLAISCDLIVAGRSATFGYPEIDVGLIPAIHYAHLPRIVGRYRAFDLLFTGRSFDAAEAAALGLVSRLVEDDEVLDCARELAQQAGCEACTGARDGKSSVQERERHRLSRERRLGGGQLLYGGGYGASARRGQGVHREA